MDININGIQYLPANPANERLATTTTVKPLLIFIVNFKKLFSFYREGVLREIPYNENEKRDLILLRNELTYYLGRKVKLNNSNGISQTTEQLSWNQKLNSLQMPELPEPINHHSACDKCPYNIICCSYLRYLHFLIII